MPKGYIIAEVAVNNPTGYESYRSQVMATVEKYGGKFVVRGGDPVGLEGAPPAGRIVVIEFESPEKAMAWYNSPEYQAILPIRMANSAGRALCVVGA